MARRFSAPYLSEPVSGLASWSRNLAVFGVVAVLVSIIIVRFGFLEIKPALATFFGALACAGLSILVGLIGAAAIWQSGARGIDRILLAFLIDAALLAYPAYLALQYRRLPAIHDITTDPIDPPRYETIGRLRSRDANPIAYAGLYAAQQQKAAYPDVAPLETDASPQAAYDAAMAVIAKRRWQVINARAPTAALPGQPARDGYIEAVARTLIMGFRDDVAVRIRAAGDGTRVDVRSSSRYGRHDFGVNAARVRALLEDIEDLAGQDKPDVPERPLPKVKQPPPKPDQKPAQKPKR
jgi:uncharacterized protein (DUF1499 family)